jgi:hypothetical protein
LIHVIHDFNQPKNHYRVLQLNKTSLIKFIFSLFFVILANSLYSQTELTSFEDKKKANNISYSFPDEKSLFVFESDKDLTFESSRENSLSPKKLNNKYFLVVEAGSQVITINSENESISIRCGMATGVNNGSALKQKEIRYFKIGERKVLKYSDITGNELAKGNGFEGFGVDPSDAQIILKYFPKNLEIEIGDPAKVISKKSPQTNGNVILFIKMSDLDAISKKDIVLNLKDKEYGITEMRVYNLSKKEQRFYSVEKLSDIELKIAEQNRIAEEAKARAVADALALKIKTEQEAKIAEDKKIQIDKEESIRKENEAKYYSDLRIQEAKIERRKARIEQHSFSNIGYQGGTIAPYGISYECAGQSAFGFHISARSSIADEQDILDGSVVENKTEVDLGPSLRLFTNFYLNLGVGYGIYNYKKTDDYSGASTVEKGNYIESSFGFMKKFGKSINVNAGLSYMDIYENFYTPEVIFGISVNLEGIKN